MIKVKNLKKEYVNGDEVYPVLKGVDLEIQKGEYVAIVGPSGSGKSTLLNILGLLDQQFDGSYIFSGNSVESLSEVQSSRMRLNNIGFVFQSFNLMPRNTVLRNVELPMLYKGVKRKERLRKAKSLLKQVGLDKHMLKKPLMLSGGQRQRVAIARALANEPQLIFADEPTGSLDTKTQSSILDILKKLNENGCTIIVVTHDREVAQSANRVITIRDGVIIDDEVNNYAN